MARRTRQRISPFHSWVMMSLLAAASGTIYLHDSVTSDWVACWLMGINLSTLLVFVIDKIKAQKGWRRIPEADLLTSVLAGGTVGALAGMVLFRHKISKGSFLNSFWTVVVLQIVVICIWYFVFS